MNGNGVSRRIFLLKCVLTKGVERVEECPRCREDAVTNVVVVDLVVELRSRMGNSVERERKKI